MRLSFLGLCVGIAALAGCDPNCADGRQGTGGHCCWPNQTWSDEREACQGAPKCPQGKTAVAGGCTGPAPQCPEGMVGIGEAWSYVGSSASDRPQGVPKLTEVHVEPFCIGKFEVSMDEYRACVDAGKCAVPAKPDDKFLAKSCNWEDPSRGTHPANCVTPEQASAYCGWKGGRLPTQVEWELAALGMARPQYPWGDAPPSPQRGNFGGLEALDERKAVYPVKDPWIETAPVDAISGDASPFGVIGMASNVTEWVHYVQPFKDQDQDRNNVIKGVSFAWANLGPMKLDGTRILLEPTSPDAGFRCVSKGGRER